MSDRQSALGSSLREYRELSQGLPRKAPGKKDELGFHAIAVDRGKSPLRKYQEIMVGDYKLLNLIRHEVLTSLLGSVPGLLGLFLRQRFYKVLFREMGRGVVIGRNVTLRQASKISIGNDSVIDDYCVLSVRGSEASRIVIGNNVLIGRNTALKAREGTIELHDHADIGWNCYIGSTGQVVIGEYALVAAFCYLGGTNHHIERTDIPIALQGLASKGGVVIEDDVWLGVGVRVNDGVRIGRGSVIGAGSVVTRDIPEYSTAYGVPAEVKGQRGSKGVGLERDDLEEQRRRRKDPTD